MTVFVLTNSSIPSTDNSLPYPESFIPPNGRRGSDITIELIATKPESILLAAISAAALRPLVKSAAPRPYL